MNLGDNGMITALMEVKLCSNFTHIHTSSKVRNEINLFLSSNLCSSHGPNRVPYFSLFSSSKGERLIMYENF